MEATVTAIKATEQGDNSLREVSRSSCGSAREGLFMRSGKTPRKGPRTGGEGRHTVPRTFGQRKEAQDNLAFKCLLSHTSGKQDTAPYFSTCHICHRFGLAYHLRTWENPHHLPHHILGKTQPQSTAEKWGLRSWLCLSLTVQFCVIWGGRMHLIALSLCILVCKIKLRWLPSRAAARVTWDNVHAAPGNVTCLRAHRKLCHYSCYHYYYYLNKD